jgi:deazaflavin-dependent oxidoreductase (nitroreductase family)
MLDGSSRKRRERPTAVQWRLLRRLKPLPIRALRSGWGPGGVVLLLTTTGCRSGLPRVTPLQYEIVGGEILLGAARGLNADWVRNILAYPHVEVEIRGRSMKGCARVSTDPQEVADFLQFRLQRHPVMLRAMLLMHGLPLRPQREDLKELARDLALVRISTHAAQELGKPET